MQSLILSANMQLLSTTKHAIPRPFCSHANNYFKKAGRSGQLCDVEMMSPGCGLARRPSNPSLSHANPWSLVPDSRPVSNHIW